MQKIKNTGFIIVCLALMAATQAQAQYYVSKDFKRKGVTEYLLVYWGGRKVYYWTNTNKKLISLQVLNYGISNSSRELYYLVNFPNSQKKYRLHNNVNDTHFACTHPDGKEQRFDRLPRVFISKYFEHKGMIEYLEDRNGKLYYYTNANPQKKIALILVSFSGKKMETVYRFPNSSRQYVITGKPDRSGGLICTLPDGRKQIFDLYNWRGEIQY